MKKWIVLFAGIALQAIMGGIYAWSEFVPILIDRHGFNRSQCGIIFGVMIAVFTAFMIPGGRLLRRFGPRLTAGIGACLFSFGYLLASYSLDNFLFLIISIGLTTGAGIGLVYICPLTVGMHWFPRNKGLVTGLSVAGFGGGAIILSNAAAYMFNTLEMSIGGAFRVVAIIFGGIALLSAMLLNEPKTHHEESTTTEQRPIRSLIFTRPFLLIAISMFSGTTAGLLVIGNLKPMALSAGLCEVFATLAISFLALGNATGRIAWGQLHDRLGTKATMVLSLTSLWVPLAFLSMPISDTTYIIMTFFVGAGFGSCFVVNAAAIVNIFGLHSFPRVYPVIFLGYGLAALVGPALGGMIADVTGRYTVSILISTTLVFTASACIMLLFPSGTNRS